MSLPPYTNSSFQVVLTVTDVDNLNQDLGTKINHWLPALKYHLFFFKVNL